MIPNAAAAATVLPSIHHHASLHTWVSRFAVKSCSVMTGSCFNRQVPEMILCFGSRTVAQMAQLSFLTPDVYIHHRSLQRTIITFEMVKRGRELAILEAQYYDAKIQHVLIQVPHQFYNNFSILFHRYFSFAISV